MSLDRDVDVVVVGLGLAGAVAALAAADAGARVLVVDRGDPDVELQSAVRAAGIPVRLRTTVHELLVEAGRVVGVGYAAQVPDGASSRWLERASGLADQDRHAEPDCSAESAWPEPAEVGVITSGAVVLALDARHWEFVGPAAWAAVSAGRRIATPVDVRPPARLRLVPEAAPPAVGAELAVRRWCATHTHGSLAAAEEDRLRVDPTSRSVLAAGGRPIAGLHSAVSAEPGRDGIGRVVLAAQLAGRAAAPVHRPAGRVLLRSVG